MPALLTMISRGPKAAMAPPTARSMSAALLVSPWKALARPPALAISEAVSSAEPPSRSSAATGAPAAPRASAMPRPIPDPAPVTTAIRSLSVVAKSSPPLVSALASPLSSPAAPRQRLSSNYCLSPRLASSPLSSNCGPLPHGGEGLSCAPSSSSLSLNEGRGQDEGASSRWPGRSRRALGRRRHGARVAARRGRVGRGGLGVHPLEDVVQHEAGAGDGEARAEGHAERLGDGAHGSLGVRAGEVRGLLVLEGGRIPFRDLPGELLAIVPLPFAHRGLGGFDGRRLRLCVGLG